MLRYGGCRKDDLDIEKSIISMPSCAGRHASMNTVQD